MCLQSQIPEAFTIMENIFNIKLVILTLVAFQTHVCAASPYGFLVFPLQAPNMPFESATSCLLRSEPHTQRDDYTYVPRFGGYKLHTRARPWVEARLVCEEEGGHLAIINSVAESAIIADLYQKSKPITGSALSQYASIGFHDLYREGEFVTIHGQSLSKAGFDQWGNGQPDNHGQAEDCGSVDKNGKLNDIKCDAPYGFICEVSFNPSLNQQ